MRSMTVETTPQLLTTDAYRRALIKGISEAKERVSLAAMIILWGKKTKPIFEELKKAAERGIRVHVVLDTYTRLPFLYGENGDRKKRLKKTFSLLEELVTLGARVDFFGTIGIPPQKGRCHVKISVIDDHAYSFGGINLFDGAFGNTDNILHIKNKAWADCLEQLVGRIGSQKPPLPNGEVELDATHTVLFDGGQPKKSIIYDKACALARKAERIYYVSQMTPTGVLGALLGSSTTTCYTNRPLQMLAPDRWAQAFDLRRYRIKNAYRREPFLHAKFILFELPNGKRALITGSHNFSYRGVVYGTQEVALYSTDKKLWDTFYTFMQEKIAN